MDVVSAETDEVYKKEYQSKLQVYGTLLGEVKAQTKQDRYRNPAQIEDTCKEVHQRPVVNGEILVRSKNTISCDDTEERFFGFVQPLYIDRVYFVVGTDVHPIVRYGKDHEGHEGNDQLLGLRMDADEYI